MATLIKEFTIQAPAEAVWESIRDVGGVARLFPGVVTHASLEGAVRTVKFTNGLLVRERIITVEDDARRFVYAAVEGRTTHHNASLQVFTDGNESRVVWITDFLPDTLKDAINQLVEKGAATMKHVFAEKCSGNKSGIDSQVAEKKRQKNQD